MPRSEVQIDRSALMRRAWAIFRATYNYPFVRFASIGRRCFAWALKAAWQEFREAAKLAAVPASVKEGWIASIRVELEQLDWMDNVREATARRPKLMAELARLSAQ